MRPLVAALLALLTAVPAAQGAELGVGIGGRLFSPATTEVVAGDSVTWRNGSNETHDVAPADGAAFAPGYLVPGASFTRTFPVPATIPYVCTIHPGMAGELDVVAIALAAPAAPPTAGDPLVLTGRAPAGSGPLTLERAPSTAGPFTAAGTVPVAADGSFSASAPAQATAAWRVTDGTAASPAVVVPVAPRLTVEVRLRHTRALSVLAVRTTPARPGDTVGLELYSRERFRWLRVGTSTLGPDGRIELTVRRSVRRLARVVYARDGAVVRSRAVALWRPAGVMPGRGAPPHRHRRSARP